MAVKLLGVALILVTAFLAMSMGGAGIFAAPITLPLLYLAVRAARSVLVTVLAVAVGGITAFELGWAIPYNLGVAEGIAGAIGLVVGLLSGFGFAVVGARARAAIAPRSAASAAL